MFSERQSLGAEAMVGHFTSHRASETLSIGPKTSYRHFTPLAPSESPANPVRLIWIAL